MRFAYADPPYLGCGAKHYGEHHAEAAVWDDPEQHRELVAQLMTEYPDGWAMSLSSTTLHTIGRKSSKDGAMRPRLRVIGSARLSRVTGATVRTPSMTCFPGTGRVLPLQARHFP